MNTKSSLFPRLVLSVVFILPFALAAAEENKSALPDPALIWNVDTYLKNPPKATWGENVHPLVREVYYEGEPCQGKATRVFAYYGRPEGEGPFPAVLLIHGGGGKAFPNWAEHWAKRGYVALAMDLAGHGPDGRLPDGGPGQSHEEKFLNFSAENEEYKNLWTYHAIAAILRGHALLAAQKEVDPNRIAATGISWGGYLTCILAGVDDKLQAAVPVYGCGFLHESSAWKEGILDKMPEDQRQRWVAFYDPSSHVGRARMPMLFVNGTNDFAYPPDSYRKTYSLPKGEVAISITLRRPHGHIFTFKEVDAFIDSVLLKDAKPLPKVSAMTVDKEKNTVSASFKSEVPVVKAELAFTNDSGPWKDREWKTVAATIEGNKASATLPAPMPTCYYILLTDERGLPVGSPIEIP